MEEDYQENFLTAQKRTQENQKFIWLRESLQEALRNKVGIESFKLSFL